jgi:manganese-dependent inorganic pyrophosphatase
VVKQDSILITSGNLLLEQHFIYEQSEEGFYLLPHILSRKKQLLPEVMRVISLDR